MLIPILRMGPPMTTMQKREVAPHALSVLWELRVQLSNERNGECHACMATSMSCMGEYVSPFSRKVQGPRGETHTYQIFLAYSVDMQFMSKMEKHL